jgi:hypothetical protein
VSNQPRLTTTATGIGVTTKQIAKAKPPVFAWPTALLNECAPIPKIHWPFDFHSPLANFLWLMPQFVTAQLPR